MTKFKDKYTSEIVTQVSEFTTITRDWNNDRDVYSIYGCWIEYDNGMKDFVSKHELEYNFIAI